MNQIGLAVFDIEGTLTRNDRSMPEEIKRGLIRLQNSRIKTTVMTSTGRARISELLGANFNTAISKGCPVGSDNGGRITDFEGERNLAYSALKPEEMKPVINLVAQGQIPLLVFYPEDPRKGVIWVRDRAEYLTMAQKFSHLAQVINISADNLYDQVVRSNPAILIFKAEERILKDLPDSLNWVVNEGFIHLNTQGVNKGRGVMEKAKLLGIDSSQVLVAGNFLNDLSMFDQPFGFKIFVENKMRLPSIFKDVVRVKTEVELGEYLSSLT
ncbi:HAD hydrolase family protein [Candidatus Daviesbacteria bacterium]|nr:HAD hydrolase family protein [Candidatus Daviesbacteria bacterium]